jgi:hypothetical protein
VDREISGSDDVLLGEGAVIITAVKTLNLA